MLFFSIHALSPVELKTEKRSVKNCSSRYPFQSYFPVLVRLCFETKPSQTRRSVNEALYENKTKRNRINPLFQLEVAKNINLFFNIVLVAKEEKHGYQWLRCINVYKIGQYFICILCNKIASGPCHPRVVSFDIASSRSRQLGSSAKNPSGIRKRGQPFPSLHTDLLIACENSRPSSLPARVAFCEKNTPLGPGREEGRLFSQASLG